MWHFINLSCGDNWLFQRDLAEDKDLERRTTRTKCRTALLYFLRGIINTLVLSLLVGAGWLIYYASGFSLQVSSLKPTWLYKQSVTSALIPSLIKFLGFVSQLFLLSSLISFSSIPLSFGCLHEQSSRKRKLSVVRRWHPLSLNPWDGFLSTSGCCFSWTFLEVKKTNKQTNKQKTNKQKENKNKQTTKETKKRSRQHLPHFLLNGPHKTTFGSFAILKIKIFNDFVTMGLNGSGNFKALLLLPIAAKNFQTSEFSSQWSPQNTVRDFCKFKIKIFNDFFLFSLTWEPVGGTFRNATPTSRSWNFSLLWIVFSLVLAILKFWVSGF